MNEANQLLRQFAENHCEDAFRQVVDQHLPLVYSAAIRQVRGDAAMAADVSQIVFADLARKAPSLPHNLVLAGWLYRHTSFVASKLIRTEARRRIREQQAASMSNLDPAHDSESLWDRLGPILDDALARLSTQDRNAILMRFFQKQDLRSVAAALQISEDAAQKRVTRAIEKLRLFFQRRGVTVSSTALLGVLAAHTVAIPPSSLAATVAATALTTTSAILLSGFEKLILMTKLKTIAAGAVVVAAVTTPLVIQYQSIQRLRDENRALREAPPATTTEVETRSTASIDNPEHRELLQLRGEVARLRQNQNKLARLEEENKRLRTQTKSPAPQPATPQPVPSDAWADAGFGSPLEALQTSHWAVHTGNIEKFKESLFITDDARRVMNSVLEAMGAGSPEALAEAKKRGWGAEEGLMFPMMAQDRKLGYKSYEILSQSSPQPDEVEYEVQLDMNSAPAQTKKLRFKQIGEAWKQIIDVQDLDIPAEVKQRALAGQ